jgi:hypothetical protein
MAYCTYQEVQLEAGTACGTATTADITALIARSDEMIADILTQKGLTAPTSSTQLKTASIAFTIAKIKRRQAHELSRTNSSSLPGLSYGVSVDTEIASLEASAMKAIDLYVAYAGGSGVAIVRNHRMIRGY